MVERPIKKSERQPQANTDDNSGKSEFKPPVESNRKNSKRDRSSKGKKGNSDKEPKQAINPALMRGPKPVKAPTNITPEPESQAEQVSEESQSEVASE